MKQYITGLIILLSSLQIWGAEKPKLPFITDPLDFLEKVEMATDRDVYFSGEELYFAGTLYSTYNDWSQIIYVELISYNGKVQYQSKHKIDKNKGISASLTLPDNILTGYYYLRAYTKWMRNYSPYNYDYKPILIINPNNDRVLTAPDNYKAEAQLDTLGDSLPIVAEMNEKQSRYDHEKYINLNDYQLANSHVSMVREALVNPYTLGIKRKEESFFDYQYLPEIKGLTLTGQIINDSLNMDVERATVFISVLDSIPYSSTMYTDQWGKFYFNIADCYGQKEVMVSVRSDEGAKLNFLIDNDFCTKKVKLPFISPLSIHQEEWEKLRLPNTNAQVEKQLIKATQEEKSSQFAQQVFYTDPTIHINIDDYIPMPSLKDYIYELIPMLGIRNYNKDPRIIIRNSENLVKVKDYSALVIYDGLFINDIKSLLNVSPRNIDYIEVFNQVYIMGNNIFGGIVNISSKNKDISDLDLSKAGLFVNYKMLDEKISKDRLPQTLKKRELLHSNTVLWSANEGVKHALVPDREGTYLLIFSANKDGQALRKAVRVKVE